MSLDVLVMFVNSPPISRADRRYLPDLARDPRFVMMSNLLHLKDRHMGVHAGLDYWNRAEDFIAKRRSGEIGALKYTIPGDASLCIV
ncbi:hypothetical protein B0H19DRAFT_1261159 [Mycena capillaripes]|nr:hypothetical protein B0H19DRAFT_1261159 [Mycena capillaripes]